MPSVNYTPYGSMGSDIGNLGSLLFPDASKVLEGRFYGAKAREAQVNTLKGQSELNERPYIMGMTPGSGVQPAPAQYYHPPGSNPNDPPIIAPSSGITMQDGSSPPLSQTVTTPAPGPVLGTPAVPPAQVADLANQAGVHTGAPPASSSPAPNSGAPPAPTTTASNGTTPTNDALSATIHPGTFWSPDGGRKMAPPAQANGSPAPLAFNPNLYMAHMLAAGYTAEQAKAGLASYILNFKNDHVIDELTADYAMSAAGNTEPLQARTSITTTGMNNATTLAQQRMVTGEQAREFNFGDVLTTDTPGGQPIHTARQDSFGKPAYDANYSTQYNTPALTQPTPGGGPVSAKQGEVKPGTPMFNQPFTADYNKPTEVSGPNGEKLTQRAGELPPGPTVAYSPEREKAGMTPVLVMDPANHNQLKTVSTLEFNKGGYVRAPANIPVAEAGTLQDRLDQRMARRFAPPPVDVTDTAFLSPARADGEDNARLLSTMTELYQSSPDPTVRGNYDNAADAAITKGQQEGWLPSTQDAAKNRAVLMGTKTFKKDHIFQTQTPDGSGTNTFYLLPKKTPNLGGTVAPATTPVPSAAPVAAAPATPAASPGTSVMSAPTLGDFVSRLFGGGSPAATAPAPTAAPAPTSQAGGAMPAGALMAVPNAVENQTGTTRDGTRFIVHGGYAFPVESPQAGR